MRDLVEGLTEQGHQIVLCSPAPPTGLTVSVEHLPLDMRRALVPGADAAAVMGLARAVLKVRPDIVHAHSSKAGALARLARARLPRTPVIYTPHGYAFAGYFSRRAERAAYRAIEWLLAPLASRVVCVCEAEAQLARSIGPSARVRVVPNGIQPPAPGPPDPHLAGLSASGPVIGALTQLRPGKGLQTLLEAAPRVLARHPRAKIAILGEGPDLAVLREQASALGVAEAVSFPGPSLDSAAGLRAIDIFVHPSWAEGFPYAVLEAMSLARPIVASDVGGIGEAVVHGQSGLLVPPRDSEALALALIQLLDEPARARALGEAALSRASSRFTRESMIEHLAGVYEEIVA